MVNWKIHSVIPARTSMDGGNTRKAGALFSKSGNPLKKVR
jgi:hypothetical protein